MPDPAVVPSAGVCPICGGDNACGLAAGRTTCWCFETAIPAAALDRVPAAARNRACICQRCATPAVSSPVPSGDDER